MAPRAGLEPATRCLEGVPTNPQLDTILRAHSRRLQHSRPGDFIFQRHEGRGSRWDANVLGQAIRDALKTAGLWRVGRGLHEFRRTATSRTLEAGVDARTVQHVLGHSTIMLLERYGAVSTLQMQRAGNALCLSEAGKGRRG